MSRRSTRSSTVATPTPPPAIRVPSSSPAAAKIERGDRKRGRRGADDSDSGDASPAAAAASVDVPAVSDSKRRFTRSAVLSDATGISAGPLSGVVQVMFVCARVCVDRPVASRAPAAQSQHFNRPIRFFGGCLFFVGLARRSVPLQPGSTLGEFTSYASLIARFHQL
jgi:hypothetical protein